VINELRNQVKAFKKQAERVLTHAQYDAAFEVAAKLQYTLTEAMFNHPFHHLDKNIGDVANLMKDVADILQNLASLMRPCDIYELDEFVRPVKSAEVQKLQDAYVAKQAERKARLVALVQN
jgi:hypothetical protein